MKLHSSTRAALVAAVLSLSVLMDSTGAAAQTAGCFVGAAGDIAGSTYQTGAQRTGDLIRRENPTAVLAAGDLAYESGSASEFTRYYHPSWGSFKSKTRPVPGNHEARTSGFAGIRSYFGETADDNRATTICGWRVVLLNPYRGITAARDFLLAQGRAYPGVPKIAVWHAPRFSSGDNGSSNSMQPLWAAAVTAGARIVVNGHDHNYERFAPMTATGSRDDVRGTRQFVSGLGGHEIRPFRSTKANSQKRYTGSPAVLFLTLRTDGSYSWVLKRYDGAVQDSGSQGRLA